MAGYENVERFDKEDEGGRWIYMTHSGGYVMAKRYRSRGKPTIFTLKEWARLARYVKAAESAKE